MANQSEWTYSHDFGYVSVANWGKPFLVITENKFFNGDHWGYNYYELGVACDTEDEAKVLTNHLNAEYDLLSVPHLTAPDSQQLLLRVQEAFPLAEIRKAELV